MAFLRILQGSDEGKEFSLVSDQMTVGRSKDCDIVIDDPLVSRNHFKIFKETNTFFIEDLKSNNGTIVNEKQIDNETLEDKSIIIAGKTTFKFLSEKTTNQESDKLIISSEEEEHKDKSIVMGLDEFDSLKIQLDDSREVENASKLKNYRKLQAMLRISNAIANIFHLNELIDELINIIFDETKATRGFIMLYGEDKILKPMAIKKINQSDEAITISQTIINLVVNDKKALLSSDLMNDKRFKTGQSIIANQIRSCMCSPLVYHDEVLGVIHIDSDLTTNIFSEDDLELLVAISNQAAACIKNTLLVNQLTQEEKKRSKLSQYFPPQQVELLMNDKLNISLGGKKELVTILFCDIRSFTAISEDLNAMEVMNFLNDFFSIMTEIVFKHEGMVDNFMGDCILAVFGGPFYHKNHQQRAVKAAIEMQTAQQELNKKFESEGRQSFEVGIGIHSGEVSRGNIGSSNLKKYTVIGSNVNVCSRLCSLAKGGEILISRTTKQALNQKFTLKELEPCFVKNVSEALIPYRVNF